MGDGFLSVLAWLVPLILSTLAFVFCGLEFNEFSKLPKDAPSRSRLLAIALCFTFAGAYFLIMTIILPVSFYIMGYVRGGGGGGGIGSFGTILLVLALPLLALGGFGFYFFKRLNTFDPDDKANFEMLVDFCLQNGYEVTGKKPRSGFGMRPNFAFGNGVGKKEVGYAIGHKAAMLEVSKLGEGAAAQGFKRCGFVGNVVIFMSGNNPEAELLYAAFGELLSQTLMFTEVQA